MLSIMKQLFPLTLTAFLLAGCDTLVGPNQSYVAPAVEGRVVDARSGAPLQNARVQRYLGEPAKPDPFAEKGAQRLQSVPALRSDAEGRFRISPEKGGYLLFQHSPVLELTLVVRCASYQTLSTNIDLIKLKPVKTNDVLTLFVGDLPLDPTE
jgi:hypothetical protein